MPFTCPRCARHEHHPEDARQGWCGACQDFTGRGDVFECGQCGTRFVVPPSHAGAVWCSCGSPEPMHAFRESRGPDLSRGLWQLAAHDPPPERSARVSVEAAARYIETRYAPEVAELAANSSVTLREMAAGFERLAGLTLEVHGFGLTEEGRRLFFPEESGQNSGELIAGTAGEESAGSQDEADVYPYDSSMRWSPGDTEW